MGARTPSLSAQLSLPCGVRVEAVLQLAEGPLDPRLRHLERARVGGAGERHAVLDRAQLEEREAEQGHHEDEHDADQDDAAPLAGERTRGRRGRAGHQFLSVVVKPKRMPV